MIQRTAQDEDHLVHQCPARTFVEIRSKLSSEVKALIGTYPTSPTPCRQFARAIRDLALRHPDGWHQNLDRSMAQLDTRLHRRPTSHTRNHVPS